MMGAVLPRPVQEDQGDAVQSDGQGTTAITTTAKSAQTVAPIVVSLGKESRKRIRQLKRGRGKLVDEVAHVMDQVRTSFGDHAEGKVLVPVVLVYRRKRRRGWGLWG
jgi:hypothetical protein